jgi:hypothetical protein
MATSIKPSWKFSSAQITNGFFVIWAARGAVLGVAPGDGRGDEGAAGPTQRALRAGYECVQASMGKKRTNHRDTQPALEVHDEEGCGDNPPEECDSLGALEERSLKRAGGLVGPTVPATEGGSRDTELVGGLLLGEAALAACGLEVDQPGAALDARPLPRRTGRVARARKKGQSRGARRASWSEGCGGTLPLAPSAPCLQSLPGAPWPSGRDEVMRGAPAPGLVLAPHKRPTAAVRGPARHAHPGAGAARVAEGYATRRRSAANAAP